MNPPDRFSPSPRFQAHIAINTVIVLLIFVMPLAFLALIPELGVPYLLIFSVVNLMWLVPTLVLVPLYVRSITYEFGERELLIRRGIITRSEYMVPYQMITNVEVKRGPIARSLHLGSLKVHTAGYSQQAGAEATLSGLENWDGVRQRVLDLIREHQSNEDIAPVSDTGNVTGREDVTTLLREIRDEIRGWRPHV
jgi:uncharacterized protein